jgi:hypothetical protein
MSSETVERTRYSCPRCGKPAGLRWWYLLPSSDRHRLLKCQSCLGTFDLSDGSKMAAMMGGLLGMGPAILLFGRIAKAGHGSAGAIVVGTIVVASAFGAGSMLLAWIFLRLEPKT